jgi:hypothetical protein
MNVKEIQIERCGTPCLVKIADEPFKREDIDLLNPNKNLPYLNMAIISQGNNVKIVLSNAADHKELSRIINKQIKGPHSCEYGQVHFDMETKLICGIRLHHTNKEEISDTETEQKINLIVGVLNQEILDRVKIIFSYDATSCGLWKYSPHSGKIVKHPF